MKLSIWSYYYYELSPEQAVERFIQNEIYAFELADEHGLQLLERDEDVVKTGKAFGEFIKERGFEVSQGHLWLKAKICSDSEAFSKLCKWIDLYEAIGIKNMVLHCDNLYDTQMSRQEKTEKNIEELKRIAGYIEDKDVTICLENLRPHAPGVEIIDKSADDLNNIIERVGSDKFGICLDTGHLNLTEKNHREFILKAAGKLRAMHIADNEGQTDQHMMPYARGCVDFEEVVRALRKVNYRGVFNLEIPGEFRIPIELRDAKLGYIKACYDYLMNLK